MPWRILLLVAAIVWHARGSPTPSPTPTLEQRAISFLVAGIGTSDWESVTRAQFEAIFTNETTSYCRVFLADCNLASDATFNETNIEYVPGYPRVEGPDLLVVLSVRLSNDALAVADPPYVPNGEIVNVLLGSLGIIQTEISQTILDIEVYEPEVFVEPSSFSSLTTSSVWLPSPSPTMGPPTHQPPTIADINDNSVLLVLIHSTEKEWTEELQAAFVETVVQHASQYCNATPSACGIQFGLSEMKREVNPVVDVVFTSDDVMFVPNYPKAVSGKLHAAFSLRIPDSYTLLEGLTVPLVPVATLLTVSLGMSSSLVENTGAFVQIVSIYKPSSGSDAAKLARALILGLTIPAALFLLVLGSVAVWLILMYRNVRLAKDRYNIHNYMASNNHPQVQLLTYRPMDFDDETCGDTFIDSNVIEYETDNDESYLL